VNDNIYANTILDYINHGFSPIPIHYKTKTPITKQWTKLRITAENFESYFDGELTNIGILTGKPSGNLVDIDIDSLDALKFAPWFLPKTNCIFGHKSKPRSHWVYRVPKVKAEQQFTANGMILEIRGNNRCTVFPGSVHPSGEVVEFENADDYDPASSTWKDLKRAGSQIAIATELYKKWFPGTRHELTLYTAAMLARLGWKIAEVRNLITAIATEANDDEREDRRIAVETTFAEFIQGRPISGDERLSQLLGPETAHNIHKWACSPDALKPHALPVSPAMTIQNPISSLLVDLTTDSSAADAFAAKFKNDLIYCNKEWFERKNQVFEPVGSELVQGLAKGFLQSEVRKVGPGPLGMSPLKSCLGRPRINAAVELSRSRFHVESDRVDCNINVIGCSDGGVIDLVTGGRFSGNNAVITKKMGTTLTADGSCSEWRKFLNRIFDNDADLIAFVRRAVGYSLTGSVSEQCLFILIGTGANGKSTFINTLQKLFGDYSASIPIQALMDQRNGSAQTNDLAYLVGKRFVAASEGERGQKLAESKIKMMTGGDRISCRAMYKDFFEFDPQFKLWLATNNLPTISGSDDAIWRRILVIPFPVTIPDVERDKTLGDRLARELPGICHWAMQGLREWRQQGLKPPARVLQSTGNYREENDTVGQWIEAACVHGPGLLTSMKGLYESYTSFCENSSIEALHNTCFGKELERRGFEKVKGRLGNRRLGIGLKQGSVDLKVA
jgi:putative DNA primase/helicase